MSDQVESVTDDLEIDGDAMAAEIVAHNAASPPTPATQTAATLVHPPVELQPDEPTAEPAEPAPVATTSPAAAATPDASAALLAQLSASQALNEKMLAALERLAQPAAPAPAPTPEDPFAGLDPNDPDDKLEIANRKVAILAAKLEAVSQSVTEQREAGATAHAMAVAQSRIVSEVEQLSTKLGITDRAMKAAMFDAASAAWGLHGYDASRAAAIGAALRNIESVYAHARKGVSVAPRPVSREPVAPVRGAGAGALPPPPSPTAERWKTVNIYDIDEMAELFAADMSGPH